MSLQAIPKIILEIDRVYQLSQGNAVSLQAIPKIILGIDRVYQLSQGKLCLSKPYLRLSWK